MSIDPLKIVLLLTQPLSVALLLALAATLYAHWLLRALAIVACLVTLAMSTPWVAERLAEPLEAAYAGQPIADYGQSQAIVLLGGGVTAGDREGQTDATAAADRMRFAAALWKAGKAPRIIATGGVGGRDWSEAHAMRAWLIDLGVDADAVMLEPLARNTRQHPAHVRPLLDDPEAPFLLVTSALHMSRSMARFAAAGLRPIAAPTDRELLLYDDIRDVLPDTRALDRSTRALKERLGMLHLRVFSDWLGR
ncbi:YdcF family protein [Algiphilus aromaticivorans]|uniref:YdcF family protein n=1 Tax=Algiphilus aromaticivorans TaxID=382454 RepID=UPI0005C20DDB|nr:YdcF family protein [Algiphilus aromaticivorans]